MNFLKNLSIPSLGALIVFNLCATVLIGWRSIKNAVPDQPVDIRPLLKDLAEKDPKFFVTLLNQSANQEVGQAHHDLAMNVFAKKAAILNSGILLKNLPSSDKTLVIFADMTCANCLTYLKKLQSVLPKLPCSVRLLTINVLGKKAVNQAKLVLAASLQDPQKAFQLALTYDPTEGASNNMKAAAKKLALNIKKLNYDKAKKNTYEENFLGQDKIAKSLNIGAPGIFLVTSDTAYVLPPSEAEDILRLVENPSLATEEPLAG